MGNKKRTKDQLDLLVSDFEEYLRQYPDENRNTLKTLRNYYLNKETIVEKEPNPTANQSTVEQIGDKTVSTIEGWYEVVTKDSEGVAQIHRLYKHSTKTRPNPKFELEPVVLKKVGFCVTEYASRGAIVPAVNTPPK